MTAIGNYTDFIASDAHGISSVGFPSEFPFAFRFNETSQTDCRDLRNDMLIYDTVMSTAFGLLLRTSAALFYWVSVCFGFWHVTLASDPRSFPRKLGYALKQAAWGVGSRDYLVRMGRTDLLCSATINLLFLPIFPPYNANS